MSLSYNRRQNMKNMMLMNKDDNERSHCSKTVTFGKLIGNIWEGRGVEGWIQPIVKEKHGKHDVDEHL